MLQLSLSGSIDRGRTAKCRWVYWRRWWWPWELHQEVGEQDLQQKPGEEEPGGEGAGVQEEQETEDRAVKLQKKIRN